MLTEESEERAEDDHDVAEERGPLHIAQINGQRGSRDKKDRAMLSYLFYTLPQLLTDVFHLFLGHHT